MLSNKKEPIILLIGDLIIFFVSLWVMLLVRYTRLPDSAMLNEHIVPFSILFIVSILVFFISGLYEKHTNVFKSRLPNTIFSAQVTNSVVAVLFFYLIPYFGITPKTNLFIYLVISFVLVLLWRIYGITLFDNSRKEKGLVISETKEAQEIIKEVNSNDRYNIEFEYTTNLNDFSQNFNEGVVQFIKNKNISIIALDKQGRKSENILPYLYQMIFSGIRFVDLHKMYEEIFDRIPLSLIEYEWFLENLSKYPKFVYDILKRVMDILVSFVLGLIALLAYPFVALAIRLDDEGDTLIRQNRIGKGGKEIAMYKYRTMDSNDNGIKNLKNSRKNRVTKVGYYLRKTRIDELPQLWAVLKGDLSLIGPRPELPSLVKVYEKDISYYSARHLIKPGLSGWAQLYQKNPPKFQKTQTQINETKVKLSYDLYYIKNRSIVLDLKIALKTIKVLLSRTGI